MAEKKKKKIVLSKKQSESILPTVEKFNGIAKQFANLLGIRVQQKQSRINILVSQIARPVQSDSKINVVTMDISKKFIKDQKKKKQKSDSTFRSPWNDDFTEKKGFII